MSRSRTTSHLTALTGAAAIAAVVALAVAVRLVDPLSSTVIPAEDPYTHMAIIREEMATGKLAHLDEGISLYPPGMHAFMAAVLAYTGADLYGLIRFAPVALGALGVLGVAMVLWRHVSPVGAVVGSLAYALAPEVIFRTSMMSPTALDLALVPFILFAALEIASGRLRWLVVAAPLVLFFVFAHPWLLGLLALMVFIFVVLSIVAPGTGAHRPQAEPLGLAILVAIVGAGLGMVMIGCAGYCGPGMDEFLPSFMHPYWVGPVVIAGSVAPAFLLAAYPRSLDRILPKGPRNRVPIWIKVPLAVLIVTALVLVTRHAETIGMPDQVDLSRMFGEPILFVAALGLAALVFFTNRLGYMAAGLALATYPLVIFDVFNSEFWPHRTAAFFGIAAALLVGIAAGAVARWTAVATVTLHRALRRALKRPHKEPSFIALVALPVILVTASLGGTLYNETPDVYSGGWYRLYPECEMDALREIAEGVDDDSLIVTGSWQARLVMVAMAGSPDRVWYDPGFFWDHDRREDVLAIQANQGGPVVVVLDRHLGENDITRETTAFLQEPRWQEHRGWCANQGVAEHRVQSYSTGGPPV